MKAEDWVHFFGHRAITARHKTTFEITKDEWLTPRGDCIVGVKADKACADLDERLKELLRTEGCRVELEFLVGGERFVVHAKGSPRLTLRDRRDMVVRKSSFVCDRTLAIGADGAASDFPRSIVSKLRDEKAKGLLVVRAYV